MASGSFQIECDPTTPAFSGDFVFNPGVNVVLGAPLPASPDKTGTLLYTFLAGGFFVDGISTPIAQLVQGFQCVDIDRTVANLPNCYFIGGAADPACAESWDTSFGWTPTSNVFDPVTGTRALLTGFTSNLSARTSNAFGSTFIFGNVIPGLLGNFALTGSWNDAGAVVFPSPPTVNLGPGPGQITIIPGPNTQIIVVTVPANPTIILPVTPGTPVVITPGATPVSILPVNVPIAIAPPVVVGDLVLTGDLVIDVALQSSFRFIGDPSGIYTLVPGLTHDVLYERNVGVITSQNVSIPRPFGVTSYIPEQD
jgi:hypothetical protein